MNFKINFVKNKLNVRSELRLSRRKNDVKILKSSRIRLTFDNIFFMIKFVKNKFNELNVRSDQLSNSDKQAEEKIETAKDEVIAAISETMDLYGVTPSAGTLYATLYLNGQMNLDEMREELSMSKPSMSTGVRKLYNNGMVKKVHQKGTRKHIYDAEKDFFKSFMSYYCQMWQREVDMNMVAVKEAEQSLQEVMKDEKVSDAIREQAKEHYELISNSKVYYRWLERLANSVRSGEIFSFLPKEEPKD